MQFAAFFRNVNFGHAGSPSKTQFLAAFALAGAVDAESIGSHGNATFKAAATRDALALANAVCEQLRQACGWQGVVHVRSMRYLAELAAADPFGTAPADRVHERCVTFLPAGLGDLPTPPLASPRRDLEIFECRPCEVFSVTRLVGGRPGNVNGLLERLLRARLTTRNWNTVMRLIQHHA